MRRVSNHLRLAGSLHISNVWLFVDPEGRRFLIDSGHPIERGFLALSLLRAGVSRPGDLTAILLTHRHSDHAGNAAWLRERFRCPVVCHPDDAGLLSGTVRPPRLARGKAPFIQEILCHIEDRFPARCTVDDVYTPGLWRWGLQVTPVPGHTEGSSFLYHEAAGVLFTGDAILAGPPPRRSVEKLYLALPGYSQDAPTCHRHVLSFLQSLPHVEALCSGHGPAVLEGVESKLRRLAERWAARAGSG